MKDKEEILDRLTDFHGHLGPYLVLGWRMGSIANRELEGNPFEMKALVKTGIGPPLSCLVDGIQFSTGCTLGKGNIEIEDEGKPVAIFRKGEGSVRLSLRKEVWKEVKDISEREMEDFSKEMFDRDESELFRMKILK